MCDILSSAVTCIFALVTLVFYANLALAPWAQAPADVIDTAPNTEPFTQLFLTHALACPMGADCVAVSGRGGGEDYSCDTTNCHEVSLAEVCPDSAVPAAGRFAAGMLPLAAAVIVTGIAATCVVLVGLLACPRVATSAWAPRLGFAYAATVAVLGGVALAAVVNLNRALAHAPCAGYAARNVTAFPGEFNYTGNATIGPDSAPAPVATFPPGVSEASLDVQPPTLAQLNYHLQLVSRRAWLVVLTLLLAAAAAVLARGTRALPELCPGASGAANAQRGREELTHLLTRATGGAPPAGAGIAHEGFGDDSGGGSGGGGGRRGGAPDAPLLGVNGDDGGSDGHVSSSDDEEDACMTCMERLATVELAPCGHKVMCRQCCRRLERAAPVKLNFTATGHSTARPVQCPMCRNTVAKMTFVPPLPKAERRRRRRAAAPAVSDAKKESDEDAGSTMASVAAVPAAAPVVVTIDSAAAAPATPTERAADAPGLSSRVSI